jgi:nucleotide sugar dehydrogenase
LPKDVNALRAYARQLSVTPHLLDAIVAVNAQRPAALINLLTREMGNLNNASIAVLGLAFKAGTDDLRESPSLRVIKLLESQGAVVRTYDPMVRAMPPTLLSNGVKICQSLDQALEAADAAMIITAWPEFAGADWASLCGVMKQQIIIDGRNVLRGVSWPATARYISVGDSREPPIK